LNIIHAGPALAASIKASQPKALRVSIATRSFRWTSASRSHPGRVRQLNEDACLDQSEHDLGCRRRHGRTFTGRVCQWPGGARADGPARPQDLEQRVSVALDWMQEVNRHLRAEALRRDVPLIGTTTRRSWPPGVFAAACGPATARIYLYRAKRLRQLTRDHSHLEAARSRRVSRSNDTLERPRANLITRALGAEDTLHIDRMTVELLDGDIFLLCTDGLSNEVSELSIEQALLPGICSLACDALIDMALDREARDNITAVVVRAEDLRSPDRTILRVL